MLLCICFSGESIPFILDMATEDEVLRAISMCKRMFDIDDRNYTVESDRIILHARKRNNPPKKRKRLYCWNDKIILQTPADYQMKSNQRGSFLQMREVLTSKIYVLLRFKRSLLALLFYFFFLKIVVI